MRRETPARKMEEETNPFDDITEITGQRKNIPRKLGERITAEPAEQEWFDKREPERSIEEEPKEPRKGQRDEIAEFEQSVLEKQKRREEAAKKLTPKEKSDTKQKELETRVDKIVEAVKTRAERKKADTEKKSERRKEMQSEKENVASFEAKIADLPAEERRKERLERQKEEDARVLGPGWVQKVEEQRAMVRARKSIETAQKPITKPVEPPPAPQPQKKIGFWGKLWGVLKDPLNK